MRSGGIVDVAISWPGRWAYAKLMRVATRLYNADDDDDADADASNDVERMT